MRIRGRADRSQDADPSVEEARQEAVRAPPGPAGFSAPMTPHTPLLMWSLSRKAVSAVRIVECVPPARSPECGSLSGRMVRLGRAHAHSHSRCMAPHEARHGNCGRAGGSPRARGRTWGQRRSGGSPQAREWGKRSPRRPRRRGRRRWSPCGRCSRRASPRCIGSSPSPLFVGWDE